jgi:4-amino-4-deoxy-L-arabinose transferase-like glycosyltransferase
LYGKVRQLVSSRHLGLAIATVHCMVWMAFALSFYKIGTFHIETDFYWSYAPAARLFSSGALAIDPFRGPLYPMALSLVEPLAGDLFTAGVVLGVVSASLALLLVFGIIDRTFGRKEAIWVTILTAVHPLFDYLTYTVGTDMFFNALCAGSVYFALKRKTLDWGYLCLSGVLAGLAYLTRYNGVFLLGIPLLVAFLDLHRLDWRRRIAAAAAFVVAFAATILPWGLHCLGTKGDFFYNENYLNVAYDVYGRRQMGWDAFWASESHRFHSLADVVSHDPGQFLRTTLTNVHLHFLSDITALMVLPVGLISLLGLILLARRETTRERWAYVMVNILFFAILILVFYESRFSLFLVPFYILMAVTPTLELTRFKPELTKKLVPLILAAACLWHAYLSLGFNIGQMRRSPVEVASLADWFNENVPAEERGRTVMARKPHFAYHAGLETILLPMAPSEQELVEHARKQGADYLYFGTAEAQARRHLVNLLDPSQDHEGLEVLSYTDNPPSVLYIVER